MSARDGDEKKQRFQDFFRGLKDYDFFGRQSASDLGRNLSIPILMFRLVESIIELFQVNYTLKLSILNAC